MVHTDHIPEYLLYPVSRKVGLEQECISPRRIVPNTSLCILQMHQTKQIEKKICLN